MSKIVISRTSSNSRFLSSPVSSTAAANGTQAVESRKARRMETAWMSVSDALATTLSALYGKLLVVMGTAFPMAEVISTYIPPSFYEAYYLYLYIGSMFFLLYMYAVLIRDKRRIKRERKQAKDIVDISDEIEKYCDFDDNDADHMIYENATEILFDSSVSKIMKKFMNTHVDPCVDFYEYACGNWRRYNAIPADRATYDTFEIVRENLDLALKGLLEENEQMKVNSNVTYLKRACSIAKLFYKSCMQEDVISKRGAAPLLKILDELGGWPILNKCWNGSNFNLILLLAKLRLLNNDILIAQWVGPDMKNSKEYIVHIDQTMLGLPAREYFLEEANLKY
nr:unnamed protein product [Callosobruchus analis]